MRMIAVDDERLVTEDLEFIVKDLSEIKSFKAFNNPANALLYVQENPVDLAFLDIEMPVMSGLELAKKISEISPDTAIVFLTGFKEYAFDAFGVNAIGYILKPFSEEMVIKEIEKAKRLQPKSDGVKPYIHTFGYFDVFIDGKPVHFSSAKSKELLALLVDRRGGSVSTENAISKLWPEREYEESVQSLFRKVLKSLRTALADAGISDIFLDVRNGRSIDVSKFSCDLYDFLDEKEGAKEKYNGAYMQGYAWAKPTQTHIEKLLGGR